MMLGTCSIEESTVIRKALHRSSRLLMVVRSIPPVIEQQQQRPDYLPVCVHGERVVTELCALADETAHSGPNLDLEIHDGNAVAVTVSLSVVLYWCVAASHSASCRDCFNIKRRYTMHQSFRYVSIGN